MVSSVQPLGSRRNIWEPLPLMIYGYVIQPLSPSRRNTTLSNRTRISTFTDASGDEHLVHRDVVSLEIGDEVYAFEQYVQKDKEQETVWYRGYAVCSHRRAPVTWYPSTSSYKTAAKVDDTQQVFIGIFPKSHIFIRDESPDAEGRLAEVAAMINNGQSAEVFAQWTKDVAAMEAMKEEEDRYAHLATRKSFKLAPPPDQANSVRARLPVYPASIRSVSPTESHAPKPLPPRPSLKSGDDTISGAEQPIVDEIASALREWHTLMFQYLARRDYRLFQIVREHIEALHLGRRQLLSRTLSAEETINLRRQCVARLVNGNIVQGLDIIVRHPTWGGLVTVDVEGELDTRSWVSAVRMYAMQVSLAYSEPSSPGVWNLGAFVENATISGHPAFSSQTALQEHARLRSNSKSLGSLGTPHSPHPTRAKFYHVFLDLRAFVASPCAPGETAELFFNLYKSDGARFVSEEFCAVLNHQGVLARDPTSRIRTIFTDILQSDAQDPIYLVCKIVRNGSMKMGSTMGSILEGGRRTSEASFRDGPYPVGFNDSSTTDISMISGRGQSDLPSHFRRPFGCAVLELTQLKQMATEQLEASSTREHTMPIFVPTHESTFSMLHQDILNNNSKEFQKSPRAEMLAVSIKVFCGDADTIIRENTSLLQDTPLSLRLGFPDVVFPGDVRNELYIKLWSGDFTASQMSTARRSVTNFARGQVGTTGNIQITIEVRDQYGHTVERSITQCSGEPEMNQFHSMVFQRMNQPTYGELVKVKLPFHNASSLHLFFTFRHRNVRERSIGRSADLSERPFAFAFLPLFPDGRAFVEDGSHTLALYKADRISQISPEVYLSAPFWSPPSRPDQSVIPPEMQKYAPLLRDTLIIRSSLVSTKFTQNSVLLSLIDWDKISDREVLSTILTMFTFVDEKDVVRFLQDIFDSLFAILVSAMNQAGEMDHLVFNALVTVLGIVQDRRYSNFQPVLDVYIESHFNYPTASSHMIRSMNRLLQDPTANETASSLRAALKVWYYILKFITRSRELQKQLEASTNASSTEQSEQAFKRELKSHLSEVNRMMSTVAPASIIGTQTIALQHFTSILPELGKVFPIVELVSIATTFANAISMVKGKMVIWKLIMYLQIVKGFLFDNPQSRTLLVDSVVSWIKPHFGKFDEYVHGQGGDSEAARDTARIAWLESIRLSITVTAVMLDKLQQTLVSPAILADKIALRQEQYNIDTLLSLLPRILESYLEFQNPASLKAIEKIRSPTTSAHNIPVTFPESYPFSLVSNLPKSAPNAVGALENKALYNAGLGETAIVFLTLALSSPRKIWLGSLENIMEIEGPDTLAAFLIRMFKVGISILSNDAFPSNWMNANILVHKVLIKIMDPIATILEREFVPEEGSSLPFDINLWREAFHLLFKLLSSEQLVIEEFSPQKRRAVWRLAGDIRGEGAAILIRLWSSLGRPPDETVEGEPIARANYQVTLNSLVSHVVNLCLSIHDQLRYNAVQILFGMIVSEYQVSGHFDDIENELIRKLDTLFMSDSKGDDLSRVFFIAQLRQHFDGPEVDPELRERVTTFLDSVDLFLELLLSVRDLPEGEEFADDRVMATLRLMNFIRRIGRDEIYIKYVHQLVNMHIQSQNWVEAALTLKLHADLHEWDLNTFAPPMEDLGLPQQSQFHRKETLCLLILDYLGKGKAWESAIEICKDLAYQHSAVTFNYARLAEILRHEAALLEHIISDQRYYSDYFRVAFYGNFPVAMRNKQFIYRGFEWEKFGAFCERMLNKHPGAQLLKTTGDPPVDIRFGTDQYVQCTAVSPEPRLDSPLFSNPDVPPQIKAYYEHCAIDSFSYQRPYNKLGPDGSEEVWVEKTILTTEDVFPTVLRRSEVTEVVVQEFSPVEIALKEVQERTQKLASLNERYAALAKTSQIVPTTPLSMELNRAVDAPPGTGIAVFRQTLLSPDYVARFPDRAEQLDSLRVAIDDQVRIIDSCLRLHGQLCPSQMAAFHGTLESFFRKNFAEEIQRLAFEPQSADFPSVPIRTPVYHSPSQSQYQQSILERLSTDRDRSVPESPSTSRPQFSSPLDVGHGILPEIGQGRAAQTPGDGHPSTKQTPLQRHLAHLARHGFNGVASGPRDHGGSDSISEGSPHDSYVNGGGIPNHAQSGPSITGSTIGSIGGSLRGRISKFGSLNFGRRDV